mgnify:FL=1
MTSSTRLADLLSPLTPLGEMYYNGTFSWFAWLKFLVYTIHTYKLKHALQLRKREKVLNE